MKRILLLTITALNCLISNAQTYTDSTIDMAAKRVQWADIQQFAIGSYGEAHYNQIIDANTRNNGKADLHRIITYLGYRFNKNLQFFSEIEFEHVSEVYVEQAFVNYYFNDRFNFKAGQLLIPMGYVNEFHEPTLFNGVERPNVDKYMVPSTWRELGFGFHGLLKKTSLKYQLYAVNGFNGYNGDATISGSKGLRSARQGGGESSFRNPSVVGKLSYYGVEGLLIEASAYMGQTESSLNNGLELSDDVAVKMADSSMLGISIAGINFTYNVKKLQFRGQGIYTAVSNTAQYNSFTSNNVAKSMLGYYGEVSYELDLKKKDYLKLIPFVRYENYNTHNTVDNTVTINKSYNKEEITIGAGLKIAPGMIFKTDFQLVGNASNPNLAEYKNVINVGFGYWF